MPVERIFDAGVMDIFIVRVAGNVCGPDEVASIEYGLGHVRTPLLVVLGHTQCGAVTAGVRALRDPLDPHGEPEPNIASLLARVEPAVRRAAIELPGASEEEMIARAVEENVWEAMATLFRESRATRRMVREGRARALGAIYDVARGTVEWLPAGRTTEILDAS